MEKRLKKALARTLGCGKTCAKLALILCLFTPALSAFRWISQRAGSNPVVKSAALGEKLRTKDLVTIYSIVRSHRPDISDPEIWRLSEVILDESSKRHLDPLLVLAIIQIESDFQHAAVSPMGARGLMQIMPDTGRYLADALHRERGLRPAVFRPESLDDPLHNIRLGTYYLHGLRKQFQNIHLALIAYNLGPGEVLNRIENHVEFSDQFAAVVLDTYQNYKQSPPRF